MNESTRICRSTYIKVTIGNSIDANILRYCLLLNLVTFSCMYNASFFPFKVFQVLSSAAVTVGMNLA